MSIFNYNAEKSNCKYNYNCTHTICHPGWDSLSTKTNFDTLWSCDLRLWHSGPKKHSLICCWVRLLIYTWTALATTRLRNSSQRHVICHVSCGVCQCACVVEGRVLTRRRQSEPESRRSHHAPSRQRQRQAAAAQCPLDLAVTPSSVIGTTCFLFPPTHPHHRTPVRTPTPPHSCVYPGLHQHHTQLCPSSAFSNRHRYSTDCR